jgi:NAD(P)-dependent dehydrogenase (short-subunit alcohol dehydrogenase family)
MNTFPQRQQGQHFIITGAGTGIGRAIALRLAAEGARVSLIGRRLEPLEEAAVEAVEAGAEIAQVIQGDVADEQSIRAAIAEAVDAQGSVRGLIANAGIGGPNHAGEGDRFHSLVATNLIGTYQSLRAVEPHLEADGAHLVVTASVLARFGVPGYTGYCASKAGLLGLVKALALELAPRQVQVNAICPGWVETEMAWQGIDGMAAAMGISREEAHARAMTAVPLGRMGQPADVAGMVAWLCSPDARGVTGQGLDMNGGAWMS